MLVTEVSCTGLILDENAERLLIIPEIEDTSPLRRLSFFITFDLEPAQSELQGLRFWNSEADL